MKGFVAGVVWFKLVLQVVVLRKGGRVKTFRQGLSGLGLVR